MNILFNIGVYMLASALVMVGYVWINYIRHTHSGFKQMTNISNYSEQDVSVSESLAA